METQKVVMLTVMIMMVIHIKAQKGVQQLRVITDAESFSLQSAEVASVRWKSSPISA
jgi:hypothetical protein